MVRKTKASSKTEIVDLNKLPEKDKVAYAMKMFEMYYEDLIPYVENSSTLDELKKKLESIPKEVLEKSMGAEDMQEAYELSVDSTRKYGIDKNVLSLNNGQEIFNFLKFVSWIRGTRMMCGVQ